MSPFGFAPLTAAPCEGVRNSAPKVGFVTLGGLGGSARVAHDVARGLAEAGQAAVLLTSERPQFAAEIASWVPHVAVRCPRVPTAAQPEWVAALATDLVRAALEHDLEVLSVHYGIGLAQAAVEARRRLAAFGVSVRICVTLHGTDVTRLVDDDEQRLGLARALESADAVTAVSPWLARSAQERLGLRHAPVVVDNGVDTRLFRPGPSPARPGQVLGYASNFRPIKRPLDAIDALDAIRREGSDARLEMVGDGPLRAAARDRVTELGLDEVVRFIDPMPQAELAAWLRAKDLLLVTSECESFGLVALEAIASGVVVAGWRCEGLQGILDRDPMLAEELLVPLGHTESLARRVSAMLDDRPRRADVRARCLAIGQHRFGRDAQLEGYRRVFEATRASAVGGG